MSRFIKREKATLPVAVRGSKKPLLKQILNYVFLEKTRGIQALPAVQAKLIFRIRFADPKDSENKEDRGDDLES